MNENEKLRQERMVFYQGEIDRIQTVMKDMLRLSGCKCALLVDKEGHMVTSAGDAGSVDVDTISALVAGSFAATREMARLLGQEEFSVMFHQGERDNIQLNLVGDRTILTVIFDDQTTVGMVRLYAGEACRKLGKVFEELDHEGEGESLELGEDYDTSASARLDSMFR